MFPAECVGRSSLVSNVMAGARPEYFSVLNIHPGYYGCSSEHLNTSALLSPTISSFAGALTKGKKKYWRHYCFGFRYTLWSKYKPVFCCH